MKNLLKAKFIFPAIFVGSLLIFLAHLTYTKTALYSDARFYYSYTMSWVKDGDINLKNDILLLTGTKPALSKEGLAFNTYSPGVSIFWIPSFWLTDNFINIVNIFGNFLSNKGTAIIYQIPVATTSVFFTTLGLYLVFLILKKYFQEKISLLTILLLFGSTNLLFYAAVEPLTSHAISFFTVSLFIYYFVERKNDKHYYLVLGMLAGISGLVRILNSFLIIIPAIQIIRNHLKSNQATPFAKATRVRKAIPGILKLKLKLALGYLIGFLPQIYIWQLFFNRLILGPSWGYGFNFSNPQITHVLFNTQNGLFTLTPVILLAILGIVLFRKKQKELALYGLLYFLIQLYLISSWAEYTQGGSYSIRMLVNTYPLLALGLAEMVDNFSKQFNESKTIVAVLLLSTLNAILIVRYLYLY